MPRDPGLPSGDDRIVDPDVDLNDPGQRAQTRTEQWDIVVAVAIGGVLGAQARYWLGRAFTHSAAQFPWSTLVINVSGCLGIGALMVLVLRSVRPSRLMRPLLGTGFLGGYTTYSTFATDVVGLVDAHRVVVAAAYLVLTVIGCVVAVWAATTATTAVLRWAAPRRGGGP